MFKITLIVSLSLGLCCNAGALARTLSAQAEYDRNGRLITDENQIYEDRQNGILQRGGYNPQVAINAERERQNMARYGGSLPSLSNQDVDGGALLPSERLSEHNIYLCNNHGKQVYADSRNRNKFTNCQLIQQGKSEAVDNPQVREMPLPAEVLAQTERGLPEETEHRIPSQTVTNHSPVIENSLAVEMAIPESANLAPATPSHTESCSGAILYKGSTYIFNESEPCPIPEIVFQNRHPIEAEPTYYTN